MTFTWISTINKQKTNNKQIIIVLLTTLQFLPIASQVLPNAELRVQQQQQIKKQFQNLNTTVAQLKNISENIENAAKKSYKQSVSNLILPVNNSYYTLIDTIFAQVTYDDNLRLNQNTTFQEVTKSQQLQKVATQQNYQQNTNQIFEYNNNNNNNNNNIIQTQQSFQSHQQKNQTAQNSGINLAQLSLQQQNYEYLTNKTQIQLQQQYYYQNSNDIIYNNNYQQISSYQQLQQQQNDYQLTNSPQILLFDNDYINNYTNSINQYILQNIKKSNQEIQQLQQFQYNTTLDQLVQYQNSKNIVYENNDLQPMYELQQQKQYNQIYYNDYINNNTNSINQQNVQDIQYKNEEIQQFQQVQLNYRSQRNNSQNYIQQQQQQQQYCQNLTKYEVESTIVGENGMWVSLLDNFCTVKSLDDILKMQNDTVMTCCGLIDQVINGACQQYWCNAQNAQNVGSQISVLNIHTRDKLQFWDLVCNIQEVEEQVQRRYNLQQVKNCPIETALDFLVKQDFNLDSDLNLNYNEYGNQYNTNVFIKQSLKDNYDNNYQQNLNSNSNYQNTPQINILHEGQQVNLQMNIQVNFNDTSNQKNNENINNIFDAIRQNPNLKKSSQFFGKDLNFLESRKNRSFTIFAPSDAALTEAEQSGLISFIEDQYSLREIFLFHVATPPVEIDFGVISVLEFKNFFSEDLKVEVLDNNQIKVSGCCSEGNSGIGTFFQDYQNGELYIIDKLLLTNEIAANFYKN